VTTDAYHGRQTRTAYYARASRPVLLSDHERPRVMFDGRDTRQARTACPSDLVRVARRKLDQLNQAAVSGDLRAPPGNRLEKLTGEREGQHSIRIDDQWRVCFRWAGSGAEDVEIVDDH
jgi:toxin HigB-1